MGEELVDEELRGIDLQTGIFTLRQIKAATNNFSSSKRLGEGGFGVVYKGLLSDGTVIAVKQLSSRSNQGAVEFVNEIGMISSLKHPNLVRLYGCCAEGNQMSLIYEFLENNCLYNALFGYMAPEYAMLGCLTPKADVYSFGIVTLELITGKSNNYSPGEEFLCLLDLAVALQERGRLLEMVDPELGSEYPSEEVSRFLNVALICTGATPSIRPTMSQTIDMLEGRANLQDFLQGTSIPSYKASCNSHFFQDHSEIRPMSDESHTESFVTELS